LGPIYSSTHLPIYCFTLCASLSALCHYILCHELYDLPAGATPWQVSVTILLLLLNLTGHGHKTYGQQLFFDQLSVLFCN
jgi:hypothetical protein